MSPEIEREYKLLLEEAEAHFAAAVRWSEDRRMIVGWYVDSEGLEQYAPETFETFWLRRLAELRRRELTELAPLARRATA